MRVVGKSEINFAAMCREIILFLKNEHHFEGVTFEYPGCVVIPHPGGEGRSWWFGTANETWTGDLMTEAGSVIDSVHTELDSVQETDALAIAAVIAGKVLARGGFHSQEEVGTVSYYANVINRPIYTPEGLDREVRELHARVYPDGCPLSCGECAQRLAVRQ